MHEDIALVGACMCRTFQMLQSEKKKAFECSPIKRTIEDEDGATPERLARRRRPRGALPAAAGPISRLLCPARTAAAQIVFLIPSRRFMSRRKQSKPKLLKSELEAAARIHADLGDAAPEVSLETAMKKCKKEDKVLCKFCDERFDDVSTLQVHTLINHSAESVRPSSSNGTPLDNLPSP
uniref:C2H2-type domain-containing protein n=1 Tax=Steinernema glaseri TaxID=37863 RepID=A0A1I7YKN5_9BILA